MYFLPSKLFFFYNLLFPFFLCFLFFDFFYLFPPFFYQHFFHPPLFFVLHFDAAVVLHDGALIPELCILLITNTSGGLSQWRGCSSLYRLR
jgi:hypothetical protein